MIRLLTLTCLLALENGNAFSIPTLQGMTVKELKQLIVDEGLNERGLMTKLKRKQDFVEYLAAKEVDIDASPVLMADFDIVEPEEQPDFEILDPEEKPEFEIVESEAKEIPAEVEISVKEVKEEVAQKDAPVAKQEKVAKEDREPKARVSKDIASFPATLRDKMIEKKITSLLPIQTASYAHIVSGKDAVVHAPTGSGKTLSYVLPLVSRLMVDKKKFARRQTGQSAAPRIVVLVPSRELAKQVGSEFSKFSHKKVVTLFGGVPMERQVSVLKSQGAHVVVSTPGRLRELVREGHISYDNVHVLVLDEADAMLDAADSPDVRAIMDDITNSVGHRAEYDDQVYQLILVSATVNKYVRDFATDIMEIEPESDSFITVKEDARHLTGKNAAPKVEHWHTAAKTNCFPTIAGDLVMTLDPQLTIVFVPTKSESEEVASFLRSKVGAADVHALHGDMTQAARSKSIATIRQNTESQQILVATDVASRGLDLPNVDLVLQFGVPKLSGREGTYNTELYTHRTGRAGRVGMKKGANTVLLYDHAAGEGKFIADLAKEVTKYTKHQVRARPIPGTTAILEAGYQRAASQCIDTSDDDSTSELESYFKTRLQEEGAIDTSDPEQLLGYLSKAMASLSRLDPAVSPFESHASLLSGHPADRTLRVYRDDGKPVTPPEVTKFCKTFGSGKLGRVAISKSDGSAVFDLTKKRATVLVNTVKNTKENLFGWNIEMPMHLP